jgi:hypothetical protein
MSKKRGFKPALITPSLLRKEIHLLPRNLVPKRRKPRGQRSFCVIFR